MKFLTSIMAIIVLLLSVQSSIAMMMSAEEAHTELSCCQHDCESPEKKKTDDGVCNDSCNPFQSCCIWAISLPQYNIPEPKYFIAEISRPALFQDRVLPQFSPDFWQPPRIG